MGKDLRILLVEDREEDAALLLRLLRREGYEVIHEVVDTSSAMSAALESQDWDVITSDHAMPQFSAPAALAMAKELRPDVPFIIVSGEIDLNLVVSLMKQGAHDYIQKRELPRLIPTIERELHEAARRRAQQTELKRVEEDLRTHQIELEMQNEELRRTYAELDASRARYFDLYDLAPVGYCTLSEKGLIVEANLTAAKLLGVLRSELVRQPLTGFILPVDQDIYYMHRKELFETGGTQTCEIRMVRADASSFWVRIDATAARDGESPSLCRAIMTDITESRRIAGENEQRQKLNEMLLNSLPHRTMLVRGRDKVVLAANKIALHAGIKIGGQCWRHLWNAEFISEKNKALAGAYTDIVPGEFGVKCSFCRGDQCLSELSEQNHPNLVAFGRNWDIYWIKASADTYLHYAIDITDIKKI